MKIYVFILFFVYIFNYTVFSQSVIYIDEDFELPFGDTIVIKSMVDLVLMGNIRFTFTLRTSDPASGINNTIISGTGGGLNKVKIASTVKLIFKLEHYFPFGTDEDYNFIFGIPDANIDNNILPENLISDNVLFNGSFSSPSIINVTRNDANDIFKHLPGDVNDTLNGYLGGNKFFDAALSGGNVAESEKALLALGEMNKATGILHLNNVISAAISHELVYNINGRQALNQGEIFFTDVPISVWFAPLAIFSSSTEEYETGIEVGSDVSSYGGIVSFDMSLPFLVTSRIGFVTGGGVGFSKSTGYYAKTSNEVGYFIGGLYTSVAYLGMRFVFSSTYIGMFNKVLYKINKADIKSDFITHNVETAFHLAYDFKMGDFYISPFAGINYSFYFQPNITFLFDSEIVIVTKNSMKNTLFIPVGLTFAYELKLSDRNILIPSVRINANVTVFDTGINSLWLFTSPDIRMEFDSTENIGFLDANFNLSWQRASVMIYGDYTLRLHEGSMTHFASIGSRWFF